MRASSTTLILPITILTLACLLIPFPANATDNLDDIILYATIPANNDEVVELSQGYALTIDEVSASGDDVLIDLFLDEELLTTEVVTPEKPLLYKSGEKTIIIVERAAYRQLIITQYKDDSLGDVSFRYSGMLTLDEGESQHLAGDLSLLFKGVDNGDGVIELYKDNFLLDRKTIGVGENFTYMEKTGGVWKCIGFGALDELVSLEEGKVSAVLEIRQLDYPHLDNTLKMNVWYELSGENVILYINTPSNAYLTRLDIFVDGNLVDSRERAISDIYVALLPGLSINDHEVEVIASAENRYGMKNLTINLSDASASQSIQTPSSEQVKSSPVGGETTEQEIQTNGVGEQAPVTPPRLPFMSGIESFAIVIISLLILSRRVKH